MAYTVAVPPAASTSSATQALQLVSNKAALGQLSVGTYSSVVTAGGLLFTPSPLTATLSAKLGTEMTMSWVVRELQNGGGLVAVIDVVYPGSSWVSFGLAQDAGTMIGSEALIGVPGAAPSWYSMSSKELSGVTPTGRAVSASTTLVQASGSTTLSFELPLTHAMDGGVEILYAHGTGNALGNHPYGEGGRGGLNVDFRSGLASTSANESKQLLVWVHLSLMLLGWGLVLPLGILMAIFRTSVDAVKGKGSWIRYHQWFQYTGAALGLAGAAVALVMVEGAHFTTTHSVIGLVVTLWMVTQVFNALVRPHATTPGTARTTARGAWEKLHKIGGRLLLVTAWLNLLSGAAKMKAFGGWSDESSVTVVATTLVVVVLSCTLLLACRGMKKNRNLKLELDTHDGGKISRAVKPIR